MAFVTATPVSTTRVTPSTLRTCPTTSLKPKADDPSLANGPPQMSLAALRLRKQSSSLSSKSGTYAKLTSKADQYMARSIRDQYKATACRQGVYGTQCIEGTTRGAAESARVRALAMDFRRRQMNPREKTGRFFEMRRMAIQNVGHNCNYEEKLIVNNPSMASSYAMGKMEANGACARYAIPESTEEAAMVNYIDTQNKNRVNDGVYKTSCQEGSYKGAAEDARVYALATSYRNAQKPTGQLLQEKYNQSKYGYMMANNCSYEEGIFAKYPAVGAGMRSKAYGY